MDLYDTNQTNRQAHPHKLSKRLRNFSKRFRLRLITQNTLLTEKINIYEKITQDLQQEVFDATEKIQNITEAHQTLHTQIAQLQQRLTNVEDNVIDQHVLKHKKACLASLKERQQPLSCQSSQEDKVPNEKQSWFTVKNVITI